MTRKFLVGKAKGLGKGGGGRGRSCGDAPPPPQAPPILVQRRRPRLDWDRWDVCRHVTNDFESLEGFETVELKDDKDDATVNPPEEREDEDEDLFFWLDA